jgi:hypothetical protein
MAKELSTQTNILSLSRQTGISTNDLKEILNGTYATRQPSFDKQQPQAEKRIFDPIKPKENITEQIKDTDEISELWSILSGLSYDQPEFVLCYEKLTNQIKTEVGKTEDKDELENILGYTPSGSPEEEDLVKKITEAENKEVNVEQDFDELINMYENNNFYSSTRNRLIEKILASIKIPGESYRLIDEIFPKDSKEYYLATKRHNEIAVIAIAGMKSTDDSDDIAQYLFTGAEEEILLAKKIVGLGKDAEEILGRNDDFNDGSEAQEILALGAIEKFDNYENHNDALDSLIGDWSGGSMIERAATAKKRTILINHVATLATAEEMEQILDEFEDGDFEKMKLEERIVELTNDFDDLQSLIDGDNKHLEAMAEEKLDRLLLEKIKGSYALNTDEDYSNYITNKSDEEDALDKKRVELCNSKDDADNVAGEIRDNSYAEYLLAQKFSKKFPAASEAPVVELSVAQNENNEQEVRDAEIKSKITSTSVFEKAIQIYNSLPFGDVNKEFAYLKVSKLLNDKLQYSHNSKEEILGLLDQFPKRTEEWSKIIQKLAEHYPKPWYKFW